MATQTIRHICIFRATTVSEFVSLSLNYCKMVIWDQVPVGTGRRSENFHDVAMKFSRRRNGFSRRRS